MLNESKGNMYEFITHTWNPIKGKCYHDCSYCYMKKWNKQKDVRLDVKEFHTDLGKNNFIFVGSSCDMWADNIPHEWIKAVINHCKKYPDNEYFFQSKNPTGFYNLDFDFLINYELCTTIESDRYYPDIMGMSPPPALRLDPVDYVTIEPILDFDLEKFVKMLKIIKPFQINIGADSGNHNLPEPSPEKIKMLISELEKFTKVHQKKNLKRLIGKE